MLTSLLLAAVILGDGNGVDCKAELGRQQAWVPRRLIFRLADKEHVQNIDALKGILSGPLKTKAEDLTIRRIGSDAFAVDSRTVDISLITFNEGAFAKKKLFDYVARDQYVYAHGQRIPSDYYYATSPSRSLWGMVDIQASTAWFRNTGSTDVVVALVDSGIFTGHEDLPSFWAAPVAIDNCPVGSIGYDALDNLCVTKARGSHGTHMAGTIGALGDSGHGVVGVSWNVTFLSSAFMDEDNLGCTSAAVNALEFVWRAKNAGANIRVVNLSWGTSEDSPLILGQLQRLSRAGIVLVASTGNDNKNIDDIANAVYPARYAFNPTLYKLDTLITVANLGTNKALFSSSNYGAGSTHIAAPGENITTTGPGATLYEKDDGTSIAAAHVTGAVALLAAQCTNRMSGAELKDAILNNPTLQSGLAGNVAGNRELNIGAAMEAVIAGKCPP